MAYFKEPIFGRHYFGCPFCNLGETIRVFASPSSSFLSCFSSFPQCNLGLRVSFCLFFVSIRPFLSALSSSQVCHQ